VVVGGASCLVAVTGGVYLSSRYRVRARHQSLHVEHLEEQVTPERDRLSRNPVRDLGALCGPHGPGVWRPFLCPGRHIADPVRALPPHSHSIVAGGLLVMSSTTRLICGTSLVSRVEIVASTESGSLAQSAVMASSLVTGLSTTGHP
jgi:hypothetical protein